MVKLRKNPDKKMQLSAIYLQFDEGIYEEN